MEGSVLVTSPRSFSEFCSYQVLEGNSSFASQSMIPSMNNKSTVQYWQEEFNSLNLQVYNNLQRLRLSITEFYLFSSEEGYNSNVCVCLYIYTIYLQKDEHPNLNFILLCPCLAENLSFTRSPDATSHAMYRDLAHGATKRNNQYHTWVITTSGHRKIHGKNAADSLAGWHEIQHWKRMTMHEMSSLLISSQEPLMLVALLWPVGP